MSKNRRTTFANFGLGAATTTANASRLDGCIDNCIVGLGHIILIGWLPTDSMHHSITISARGGTPQTVRSVLIRHVREDVSAEFAKVGRRAPFKPGFLCTFKLSPDILDSIVGGESAEITLDSGDGVDRTFQVRSVSLLEAIQSAVLTKSKLLLVQQALVAGGATEADPLLLIAKGLEIKSTIHAHVDQALAVNKRDVLVSGWIEDAHEGGLLLLDSDLMGVPQQLNTVITARNDVAAHLSSLGRRPTTNLHGFVAVANVRARKNRICRILHSTVSWSPELEIEVKPEEMTPLLGRMRQLAAEAVGGATQSLKKLAAPILDQKLSDPPNISEIRRFGAPSGMRPQTSIIVPFYGDGFYLVDHIIAQGRAPNDVEWIFVCDDPRLAASMIETLSNRQSYIKQPTQLVLLGANGGFAHANNIGASCATGDFLLLMNSDIYCDDFSYIRRGVSILNARQEVGCVGFSLQFEDRTIQHDGMNFQQSSQLDGLWTCEHPNKGMPQSWTEAVEIDVDAVTAALMLLRKEDFAEQPIFDPVYLIGDFEDADLCMRLRNRGKAITLLRQPGLYHLERQSLRYAGDAEARMAVTHVNCLTFNKRWAGTLGRSK